MAKPPPSLAAASSSARDLSALLADDNALVKVKTLKAALAGLLKLIPDPGAGITIRHGSNGPVWTAAGGAASGTAGASSNWEPIFVDATHILISPGSFNLTVPFIDTGGGTMVALNATTPPQLTVDASALQIIYLVVDTNLQTNADNFVTGFTLKSPTSSNLTIEAHSTVQASTNTKRFFELCRWQAGALVNRTRYNNISARAEDNGTATATANWVTW